MTDLTVLEIMSEIHDQAFRGDFVVFGKRKKRRTRRRKTDPYYKAGIAASRRRRTKARSERL